MKRGTYAALLLAVCAGLILPFAPAAAQSSMWHVEYFPNKDWAGYPVMIQDVPYLYYDWGYNGPGGNVPPDNWTARATGSVFFYGGVYRITVLADDEAWLQIDGVTYLDTRGAGLSGKTLSVDVPMYQGSHNLRVDYREYTEAAYLYVTYALIGSSGGGTTPLPPELAGLPPLPQSAPSVQTRYGDYTPCIQASAHQSQCFVSDGQWDSPNIGSIEMEPPIQVWGNCVGDTVTTFLVTDGEPKAKEYKCSKTEAGWFPN